MACWNLLRGKKGRGLGLNCVFSYGIFSTLSFCRFFIFLRDGEFAEILVGFFVQVVVASIVGFDS